MKKLILILFLSAFAVIAQAQITPVINAKSTLKPLISGASHAHGLDTVTNSASVSQVLQIPGYNDAVTIQTSVTKLTGTPTSGGSVKLYGSIDGTIYDLATASTDTLAVGNVTPAQVHTWMITPSKFSYYKIIYKGSGTQTSKITSGALIRKQ